jgi:CBS domain-containing protein
MRAADVMTRPVVSVTEQTPIEQAIGLMLQHNVSGLPVVDDAGAPVGIVTEGDFLRRSETGTERHRSRWLAFLVGPGRLAGEFVRSHGRRVGEVMTREVVCVDEETALGEIVGLMERRRIKRVPVLREGKLVGIVSRANLLRALAGLVAAAPASAPEDDVIRARMLALLDEQAWAPRGAIGVAVRDGVVHLTGVIFDEEQRRALRVAAETIPGAKGVKDHLAWVEPTSGFLVERPPEGEPVTPPQAAG